jgi:hypothetical protein
LKCDFNKTTGTVFQKSGKFKITERWRMNGQNTEAEDKLNYLGVFLVNTGRRVNKKKH